MTRFIYNTATTLNGFLADPNNSLDWLFEVDLAGAPDMSAFMESAGVLVEGSTTYEWVLAYENLLENPRKWQQLYGTRATYVFTSRELPVPEGADVRFVSGNVSDFVAELTQAAQGKDVWVLGGGELAGAFIDAGALDEIVLSVAPASLNDGAPLLPRNLGSKALELMDAKKFGQFAQLSFRVVK